MGMAGWLAEAFRWTAKNWLEMQRVYDLWQARGGTGENKRLLTSHGMATGLFAAFLTEGENAGCWRLPVGNAFVSQAIGQRVVI